MNFSKQHRWMLSVGTLVSVCFLFFLISLSTAFAANYTPLVGIPGLATGPGVGLASYLNRLYVITIGIGAIIAFIKIAMAGVKWSMSDVVTDKGVAKEDIKGALLGLAILLIPFIVLNTIYPGLTSLKILQSVGKVDLNQTSSSVNLDTTGGYAGNGRSIADICNVRAGDIPPPGCAVGGMTPVEQQLAQACTASGGTYSVPTRTCIGSSGGGKCTVLPQINFPSTKQVTVETACGGAGKTEWTSPTQNGVVMLSGCCI